MKAKPAILALVMSAMLGFPASAQVPATGEGIGGIFHPLEVGAVVGATATGADIGETVGFERLAVPVEVQRLVLRAVG